MSIIQLLPVILSALLLGAHFFRDGQMPLVVLALVFPAALFFKRAWAARFVQIILLLGALEWVRTLLDLVAQRRAFGDPWVRLAIILGLVAVFTASSALVFSRSRSLRTRYGLDSSLAETGDTGQSEDAQ